MKQNRVIAMALSAVNLILIVICAVFCFRSDRTEPEFKFQVSDLIYRDGMEQEKLLENITASDDADGDVTQRIVIEKIVKSKQENSVIVFYAVSDRAGNVAKISRAFPAEVNKKETADALQAEPVQETSGQASATPADSGNAESQASATPADGGEAQEQAEESIEAVVPEGAEEADSRPGDADRREEETPEEADTQEPPAEDAAQAQQSGEPQSEGQRSDVQRSDGAQQEGDKGKPPVITLKTTEVNTTAGVAPAWVDVIGSLTDDRDSYETLFYNLSISKYDVNKAGTYKVALTTKDSDGNKSDPVTLTIHVK